MYLAKPPRYNFMSFASRFQVPFPGIFGNANEIAMVLIAFQKIGKNTHGQLELMTSLT